MALLSFRVQTPMKRFVLLLFAVAILAPDSLAGQPAIATKYGEWTMMGHEDPMDGWSYVVNRRVYALSPLVAPYHNAALSVNWTCNHEGQRVWISVNGAPPIGRLRRWDPPARWYLKNREISRYETYEQKMETERLFESRVRVRVRWDEEPPTEIRGSLMPDRRLLYLFIDPLGVDGVIDDPTALSDFLSNLSDRATLLVEIPWVDPQLPRSHFRIPLDGAAEAIEDARRRCSDPRGR